LNHLLPPKRIFTNLRARAGHPFPTQVHYIVAQKSLLS